MVFSDAENRGPHGQPGPDRTGGRSEADSTPVHSRGGETRSLSAGCEGAGAGLGDGQEPPRPWPFHLIQAVEKAQTGPEFYGGLHGTRVADALHDIDDRARWCWTTISV